ncbi:F-box/LRR-repeat protein 20 [Punica granatum]|uniref:F-box/LRR-repeat protein 15-like leucin rich repeat domain-containing protein n=2 Tax=Punica granatum TaxID=22663 RepID=A0A218Y0B1_PUNGR|nr:F-box/LRR-repeat protein 20 [Punica granatum]OWM90654.1 hypothetical protein CDL15_Pgr020959 [Punica granatum]PKI69582.1 hypothetical protein CRG98_010030 [Punica granatum]
MASPSGGESGSGAVPVCINEILTDDELRSILSKLDTEKDRELFGFVCKRWLHLQSSERRKLAVRAGTHMLIKLATRFFRVSELDLSQSVSRSFYPGVTDKDLYVIASNFRGLKVLHLQNCKGISDVGMIELGGGLSSLQSLDVSYCRKVTDRGLEAVAKGCHDLRRLQLAGCRLITDLALQSLSENCQRLEELGLQGCTSITDFGITQLVKCCKKIKLLDISKCSNVGDEGVSNVAKSCSLNLKTLKLLDCYEVKDESIISLATYCKNLETLVISGCKDISDEAMKSLASACGSSLRKLRMDWCLSISDCALSCILTQCRSLEALDIGCCEGVTDAAFNGLESGGVELGLKVLKVSNCHGITVTGIRVLLDKCRSLEYLDVRSCPRITKAVCDEAGLQFPERCKVNFDGSLSESNVYAI